VRGRAVGVAVHGAVDVVGRAVLGVRESVRGARVEDHICLALAPGRDVQADEDRAHEPPRRPARALRRVVRAGAGRSEGRALSIRAREAVARDRARVRRLRFGVRLRVCGAGTRARCACECWAKPVQHVCEVASAGSAALLCSRGAPC
jgi:hypothetical protein